MIQKYSFILFFIAAFLLTSIAVNAQTDSSGSHGKLMFGGYGEIVFQHFNYSDDFNRYLYPEDYASGYSYGTTDMPHLVFYMAYDFGSGWKFSTEIEFEHGGSGAAIEIEAEEFGEYEQEVEKGGEIALEQFWIEKNFSPGFNLRLGHFVVPVGATNNGHFPVEYFTVTRPEGESTIIPCTWHETGVSVWGNLSDWRYEVQLINGLDADRFGSANWVNGGASPYEYKLATNWAGAIRIDNHTINGLRLSVSGYYGLSASNSLKADRYAGIDGAVSIASFDCEYNKNNIIARGNIVYGNLEDSKQISTINKSMPQASPSPHTDVASNAMCYSAEAGYNILSFFDQKEKLFPFVRYEYYNSMEDTEAGILADERYKRNVLTAGVNYFPLPQIVLKAEYSSRMFSSPYNDENTISVGIMYTGFFTN